MSTPPAPRLLQTWTPPGQLAPWLRSGRTFSIFPRALMGCPLGVPTRRGEAAQPAWCPPAPPSCAFGCHGPQGTAWPAGTTGPEPVLVASGHSSLGHQGHGIGADGESESRAVFTCVCKSTLTSSPGLPTIPSFANPLPDEVVLPVPLRPWHAAPAHLPDERAGMSLQIRGGQALCPHLDG